MTTQTPLSPLNPLPRSREWAGAAESQQYYRSYSVEEDTARTNVHYEQPWEFFYAVTGGEWNVYSCNFWSAAQTDTESQEAKLDLLAQHMELKPGQRILDVGCGWGGPLVYLTKKYGVEGVGLTLSPTQKRCADERIARHGANAQVVISHWERYQDERPFDAIYTDEVIVHFHNLGGFFARAYNLLRPGGKLVNKELHFVHSRYRQVSRATALIAEIYGLTGNYRMLHEELALLDQTGFAQTAVQQIGQEHYLRTVDRWLENMADQKQRLVRLVGAEYYRRFRTYLKVVRKVAAARSMTIDIVVGQKLAEAPVG